MVHAHPIDLEQWPRRAHFEHYRHRRPTYFALTVGVDVTRLDAQLRTHGRRTYPAHIWALATVVNRHEEFRMTVDDDGNPAIWDVTHPSFTVFNPRRETFSNIWAHYDPDFRTFHDRVESLIAEHRDTTSLFPQGFPPPPNLFDISSLPWVSFDSFTLHVENGWSHYAPVFTLGKFTHQDDRLTMPVSLQIHHAAADGFHASRLLNELSELIGAPDWVS
ncbi:CatA-like O-acetyltransferase [Streptomyces cacaoi]|uniref:CatA-like O-acetyltransferase n=1 Tax=Streptomyces cacaoi TaxID=1898 RepID=UPI0011F3EC36|nr:CatA-like O-acetyltransferase [Streptomyces cacaoi]